MLLMAYSITLWLQIKLSLDKANAVLELRGVAIILLALVPLLVRALALVPLIVGLNRSPY
jgi:hypothetical protein